MNSSACVFIYSDSALVSDIYLMACSTCGSISSAFVAVLHARHVLGVVTHLCDEQCTGYSSVSTYGAGNVVLTY